MGRGGSEAAAMWTLQALQDSYRVTFATSSPIDWEELNGAYGTSVRPDRVELLKAPAFPTVKNASQLVHIQRSYFERFCQSVAHRYDLVMSAYNPIDFGKPGVQLIGDFSFDEGMRKRLYVYGEGKFCHRDSLLRRAYLGFSRVVGVSSPPLSERDDLVLANSAWSSDQLDEYFHVREAPVIYPPVVLPEAPKNAVRDPLGFVCLGRIVPEKELERIIRILSRVREAGYPVMLRMIGNLDDTPYSRHIGQLVEPLEWVQPEGFLELEAKQKILSEQTFAIHACRIEAFGIAVAEMASMGCLPFVPDTGGAGEIIGSEELQFGSDDEAVEKIVSFLQAPEKVEQYRRGLPEQMNRFGPKVFMKELCEYVVEFSNRFSASSGTAVDAAAKKDFLSTH